DSELYTKIYYVAANDIMIRGCIGKNINQCNMNENVLVYYTKTNKSYDKNNKIQNKNNLKNQNIQKNILKIAKVSCNTQIDKVKNQNPDLINKYQHCQKNVEIDETQANLGDANTKDREEVKKGREIEESQNFVNSSLSIGTLGILVMSCLVY
ncbi:hypothetical protein SLOPH_2504, partial [Spraguea lophii 42_110]